MARRRDKDRRTGRQKRKISEMIWEFAGDFIRMAETPEQRQRTTRSGQVVGLLVGLRSARRNLAQIWRFARIEMYPKGLIPDLV
jgi:hypothetical protein